ncbi:MAG TPA: glycosyltransferase [Sediminibacterium sp.]|nr:glycosyltransferase [Sediminibacterium sp.]
MTISIIGSRGYPYVYSGYETFVKELSERLVKKGYHVKIYCHKNLFSERPPTVNGIELVYLPTIETKSLSQLIHSCLSMIHACTSGSDIILAVNAANGPWGLISTLFRKKTLINVDGMEWLRPKWKGLGAKYFRMAAWLSTKLYNRVITDAEAMREVYLEEFKAESTVIAYGAEPRYAQKPELLEAFALEPYSYYLIVGRLIPDNNVALLLEGYQAAQSGKKLVVVGDVPYQDEYARKMKAKANADILFLGYITNSEILAELYHHCYAYLHGHEFGGTNPTMLKAMAYGCAILAIDTRFSREMLQDGRFGLLFQKSPQSVAALMQQSEQNNDLINNLRQHAREGLGEKYNWDQVTEAYIRVFKELQRNGKKSL